MRPFAVTAQSATLMIDEVRCVKLEVQGHAQLDDDAVILAAQLAASVVTSSHAITLAKAFLHQLGVLRETETLPDETLAQAAAWEAAAMEPGEEEPCPPEVFARSDPSTTH